ncbi:hypothetical protein ACFHW2_12035 [Actinomadura sp. LOL_016]|uniref:DUF7352 domain-containing protein n=1 Tax=unclassified Actinomadura TaxID=2626254 RepID=UPI003A7FA798
MPRRITRHDIPTTGGPSVLSGRPSALDLTFGTFHAEARAIGVGPAPTIVIDLWAEDEPRTEVTRHVFQAFETGAELPDNAAWRHTTGRLDGRVWHVYELIGEDL